MGTNLREQETGIREQYSSLFTEYSILNTDYCILSTAAIAAKGDYMKKYIEDEIVRGFMIALLGVFMMLVWGEYDPYSIWGHSMWQGIPKSIISFMVIIGIGLFAMIMRSAGHYRGKEFVTPNYFDAYPLEIYIFFDFMLFMAGMFVYAVSNDWLRPVGIVGLGIIYLSAIFGCMSVAVRCKMGNLLTNTVVYHSYDKIKRFFGRIIEKIEYYITNLPLYRQLLAIFTACRILCMMGNIFTLIGIGGFIGFVFYLFTLSISYHNLGKGIEKIAGGNTEYQIDTTNMPLSMKKQAESLNSINTVVSEAVTQRIKSEQFKTELITNVSHDIKTPLTSIINYIDLIKKEEITTQPMADYVAVLDRQSARLKKLIEDLVEASKASTGNIAVNLSTTDLNLLLAQAVGEYTEKAEARQLEFSVNMPEKEIYTLSDGRLLWRVFDNILNNACKYSAPGTRVYINMAADGEKVIITFKNVSRQQLNISPDELMERFVRGDSSRNTEGSGLGLSIARSLTEILGGVMALDIDGDLFKVTLEFGIV